MIPQIQKNPNILFWENTAERCRWKVIGLSAFLTKNSNDFVRSRAYEVWFSHTYLVWIFGCPRGGEGTPQTFPSVNIALVCLCPPSSGRKLWLRASFCSEELKEAFACSFSWSAVKFSVRCNKGKKTTVAAIGNPMLSVKLKLREKTSHSEGRN